MDLRLFRVLRVEVQKLPALPRESRTIRRVDGKLQRLQDVAPHVVLVIKAAVAACISAKKGTLKHVLVLAPVVVLIVMCDVVSREWFA